MSRSPGKSKEVARRQRTVLIAIHIGIVLIGLIAGYFMDRVTARISHESQQATIKNIVDIIETRAEAQLQAYTSMAKNMAVFMDYDDETPLSGFRTLAGLLSENNPAIINIALAEDLVVTQVYPLAPNRGVLGLDISARPDLMKQVQYTLETGEVSVVGPVRLVQGRDGIILRSAAPNNPSYLYSIVLDAEIFLEAIGASEIESEVTYVTAVRGELTGASVPEPIETTIYGDAMIWDQEPLLATVQLGQNVLEIGVIPEEGWITTSPHRLTIALVLSVIAAISFWGVNYARILIMDRSNARRQLIGAIEALEDGFVIYDEDDRLLMCNDRYREIYRESADLMVPGTPFEKVIRGGVARGQYPEAEGNEEEWIAQRLEHHKNPKAPVEQQLSDGRWVKVAESKTRNGYTVGYRGDISALKGALQQAEQANIAKTDFLNNISHEFRTPLSIVLGYIAFLKNVTILPRFKELSDAIGDNTLAREKLDAFAREIATQAEKSDRSGKHLMGLINSVLDWSTLSVGEVELKLDKINMGSMLRQLCDELETKAKEKDIALTCSVFSCGMQGDELRLRQVFINLITNAIKFTDSGGIHVEMAESPEGVAISVEDTGAGIPADQLDRIFERFAQVDGSTKRKFGGAGLGLAISRSLVELHGGRIQLESTLGKGSRFTVHLPAGLIEQMEVDQAPFLEAS